MSATLAIQDLTNSDMHWMCQYSDIAKAITYVAMEVWWSEGVFLSTPSFWKVDKVGHGYSWRVALAGENGEDAWIRVVKQDRTDRSEHGQVVLVWHIVAVIRNHILRVSVSERRAHIWAISLLVRSIKVMMINSPECIGTDLPYTC